MLPALSFAWWRRGYKGQSADLSFAKIAQGATVTEATMPSGFKVPKPKSADGDWKVFGNSLVLVKNQFIKFTIKNPLYALRM